MLKLNKKGKESLRSFLIWNSEHSISKRAFKDIKHAIEEEYALHAISDLDFNGDVKIPVFGCYNHFAVSKDCFKYKIKEL